MTETARERWDRVTEWPLLALALLFLGAYAWPILDPDLDPAWQAACWWVTWVTWAVFVADYLVRVRLSPDAWAYVRGHVLDLLVVLLPVLRPLRLLRLVTVLAVLNRRAGSSLRGSVILYAGGGTLILLLTGALAVLDVERGEDGAVINSFGESLWWGMTTVTTVGYGDRVPVTTSGRAVAAVLMVAGIAMLGVLTASLASYLVERVSTGDRSQQPATQEDMAALRAEVAALREELAGRGATGATGSTGAPQP